MPLAKVPETEWKEKLVNQNVINRKKVQKKKNDKDWTIWEQKKHWMSWFKNSIFYPNVICIVP